MFRNLLFFQNFPPFPNFFKKNKKNKKNKIKKVPVNQSLAIKKLDLKSKKGLCGGLAANHVNGELSSSNQDNGYNPFDNEESIYQSDLLQQQCGRSVSYMIPGTPFCFEQNDFQGCIKKSLSNEEREVKIKYPDDFTKIKSMLEGKIKKTMEDKTPRGFFIGAKVYQSPTTKKPINGSHAFSITARPTGDGKTLCTGMDSNFFYVEGKGQSGCNQVVNEVIEQAQKYQPKVKYVYKVKKR